MASLNIMTIKDFSRKTELPISTIRYYDKLGLFPTLKRNKAGYRIFTEKDIIWLQFINRLKNTGMSIKDIINYSELRDQGEETIQERMEILKSHRSILKNKIDEEVTHLENIDKKIEIYKSLLP